MSAPSDLERRATQILDNDYWLQTIICQGCTHWFHSHADIVDGCLVLSNPECLNPDCPGHDSVAVYQKALQTLADHGVFQTDELMSYGLLQTRKATDDSSE